MNETPGTFTTNPLENVACNKKQPNRFRWTTDNLWRLYDEKRRNNLLLFFSEWPKKGKENHVRFPTNKHDMRPVHSQVPIFVDGLAHDK